MEWAYYGLSYPFEGAWSPFNLRLGSCGLADGAWVYGPDGELYYGPTNTDCTDSVNDDDAMCDCDLEIVGFNPSTLDIEVEVVSHWNCGQPLNGLGNTNSMNTDAVGMINFGIHVPGWDYQWGCTTDINHPGWAFTGWSALNNPNQFLYSGDVFEGNLNNLIPPSSCFNEILTNDTITECKEIVLWQINYSQTLNVADGGWAVNESSDDDTQEYPDSQITDNSIIICGIPSIEGCTDPSALNYNPQADVDDGSCEYGYPNAYPGFNNTSTICDDGVVSNIYNITTFNSGNDTLFYYCVEIPEFNYDECFNGYINGVYWIPPGEGQLVTQVIVPEGIEEFTVNIYLSEGESEETLSNNSIVVPVVFNGPDPCSVLGCTDINATNYNPDANEDDGSCQYLDLTLNLGNDVIWTPQGTCVNPSYNQSFVVNNTGEGVIDNFTLEVTVVTWDGDIVYNVTQDYNVSVDPNGSYTVSDLPDVFTGDLNYVNATLTWVNELGELEEDVQSFNLILYCWGCIDPEANNYTESDYIFDEVPTYWLTAFPNILPPNPDQIECTYDIFGCTDSEANNYNPNANVDDGSCTYDVLGCTDSEANNYNPNANVDDGSCTYDVLGCTDSEANNYNPNANVDDGSCTYDVLGCTDSEANNYNPNANVDDGSCTYDVLGCTDSEANNYNPNANVDDGSCTYDVLGCTDSEANNYNPNANVDDGSCTYDVLGCTDSEANNYNPNANVDDGSCTYDVLGCTDMNALNYNTYATIDDGTCIYPGPCDEFDGSAFAPNAFTPNNDGLNDVWRVLTEEECWNRWELIIYNRWGQVVYEMDNPSQFWDGSFRGGDYYVTDGVYAYTLRGVAWNLSTVETTGFITVLR